MEQVLTLQKKRQELEMSHCELRNICEIQFDQVKQSRETVLGKLEVTD